MLGAKPATSEPAEKMTRADLDQQLLAEQVGELAPDRRGRRHRQQGRDDDPGVAGLAALEVGDDRRQRVGDDGAGQHRDEHREQQAGEGLEHLAVRHLAVGLGRCRSGSSGGGWSLDKVDEVSYSSIGCLVDHSNR